MKLVDFKKENVDSFIMDGKSKWFKTKNMSRRLIFALKNGDVILANNTYQKFVTYHRVARKAELNGPDKYVDFDRMQTNEMCGLFTELYKTSKKFREDYPNGVPEHEAESVLSNIKNYV
jgi:hypothetical protein